MPRLTAPEVLALLHAHFPHIVEGTYAIDRIEERAMRLRQRVSERNLRPGGTIAGPTLMGLADTAAYLLLLSQLGDGPVIGAATTSLTIHFLRRPKPAALVADARVLRLGKRLAVVEVFLSSEGDDNDEPVAHATVTYAIPSDVAASKGAA